MTQSPNKTAFKKTAKPKFEVFFVLEGIAALCTAKISSFLRLETKNQFAKYLENVGKESIILLIYTIYQKKKKSLTDHAEYKTARL